MSNRFNKAKNFYKKSEKSSLKSHDPIAIVKTMVSELQKSMDKVILSTGIDKQREVRAKHFSRSLVIIYTLQTTLDFDKGENLATKLFQIYEFCRQQLIKCFREQVVHGAKRKQLMHLTKFLMPRNQNRMGDTSISINSQLDRLEKISDQISRLISSGDYNKICHLDRIRKKK